MSLEMFKMQQVSHLSSTDSISKINSKISFPLELNNKKI